MMHLWQLLQSLFGKIIDKGNENRFGTQETGIHHPEESQHRCSRRNINQLRK
ncbi:hypothetical protein ACFL27_10935 [candidate division CSSED10-310 bacterium]|uniref:Uncharacterized protein n=1 Tax=candidate division CSSED10-310 bacterium TaxID=2855610 RepID=A0ABV6YX82_UNCC1